MEMIPISSKSHVQFVNISELFHLRFVVNVCDTVSTSPLFVLVMYLVCGLIFRLGSDSTQISQHWTMFHVIDYLPRLKIPNKIYNAASLGVHAVIMANQLQSCKQCTENFSRNNHHFLHQNIPAKICQYFLLVSAQMASK